MAITDDRTPRLNLPLPVTTNQLQDDCSRLRETIASLDEVVATLSEDGRIPEEQIPLAVIKKLEEVVSVTDFPEHPSAGDGVTDCSAAFAAAEAASDLIYVPKGTFFINSFVPSKYYFGPGVVKTTAGTLINVSKSPQPLNYSSPNTVAGVSAKNIGTFNTIYGFNVGANFGAEAKYNVLVGHNLASGDTIEPETNAPFTGIENVGVGYHALKKNQTGSSNVGIGRDALNENKTGNHNIGIGTAAAQQVINSNDNVMIGGASGARQDAGNGLNTYVGRDTGRENKDGTRNALFGWAAGRGETPTPATFTGDGTTTTFSPGTLTLTSVKQVRIDVNGVNVLPTQYTVSGTNVVFNTAPATGAAIVLTYTIGASSFSYNAFFGAKAGYSIKTGSYNVAMGDSAGSGLKVGSRNVLIGFEAGLVNDGDGNVMIGNQIGKAVTGVSNRLMIGNGPSTPLVTGFFDTLVVRFNGSIQHESDNTYSIGSASRRSTVVYAATATINTSDERLKTFCDDELNDAVLDVWATIDWQAFRFNDAIEKKGAELARIHFGLGAQTVIKAFADAGIDATRFALICYDEWEEEPEIRDKNGVIVQPHLAAGNRYGIRYEEALALEAALMRRATKRLEDRLAALEAK